MRYAHTTIFVKDLKQSLAFYQEFVGLKIVRQFSSPDGSSFVFLADRDGGTEIELIYDSKTAVNASGISLGFSVADANAFMYELDSLGIAHSPMVSPNPKTRFFFLTDPDGVQIQFIEQ